jgi:hypothetical protein
MSKIQWGTLLWMCVTSKPNNIDSSNKAQSVYKWVWFDIKWLQSFKKKQNVFQKSINVNNLYQKLKFKGKSWIFMNMQMS